MYSIVNRRTFTKKLSETKLLSIRIIILLLQFNESQAHFNETSCHNTVIKDDLPSADGQMHFFPVKSIFFIGTSCNGGIKPRQACSIESAARVHQNWQINVLFAGPVPTEDQKGEAMTALKKYPNIKFFRIHIGKFSQNTPLEHLMTKSVLNLLQCRVRHSAEVLRLIALYRWGGVFLDMGVIVMKPFDSLAKIWVARESDSEIGSSYLALSKDKIGKTFVNAVMKLLDNNLMELSFANKSGALKYTVLHVLRHTMCSESVASKMSADTCNGFEVYHQRYFNPVHHSKWFYFFKPGNISWTHEYALQTWSFLNENAYVSELSPFIKIAETFCPVIYEIYRSSNFWKFELLSKT